MAHHTWVPAMTMWHTTVCASILCTSLCKAQHSVSLESTLLAYKMFYTQNSVSQLIFFAWSNATALYAISTQRAQTYQQTAVKNSVQAAAAR